MSGIYEQNPYTLISSRDVVKSKCLPLPGFEKNYKLKAYEENEDCM